MLQSLAGLDGHGEPEGRPTAEGALHTYGATPLLHDGLGNGQSEARAGFGAIGSIKTIEHIGQMFFADAFARTTTLIFSIFSPSGWQYTFTEPWRVYFMALPTNCIITCIMRLESAIILRSGILRSKLNFTLRPTLGITLDTATSHTLLISIGDFSILNFPASILL